MTKRNQKLEQKPARASSDAGVTQGKAVRNQSNTTKSEAGTMTSTTTSNIKIADLTVSRHNVRFQVEPSRSRVQELADNIAAIGRLIHPVVVLVEDGIPGVVAGKTRLRALQLLVESGRLPAGATTLATITDSVEQAGLISLSENVARENMHPADECTSYRDLVTAGKTVESIAVAFGVTVRYIEGRLRIANLAPALMAGYRSEDFPNLEQVMALCLTDDHAKQTAVWEAASGGWDGYRRPPALREAIVGESSIDALRDRRTAVVSLEDYESAGGKVTRSLFGDQVFMEDPELFAKLVTAKLQALAASVGAEGWSWVEVVHDRLEEAARKLAVSRPARRELSDDESVELAGLQEQAERASKDYQGAEEGSEAEAKAERLMADIQRRIEAMQEARESYSSRQLAKSGALVGMSYDGAVKVLRGLVRREDRADLETSGGRLTGDAGRPKGDALSQAHRDDLHGLRILAVQSEVARNPRAAKIMLALWSAEQIEGQARSSDLPTDLSVSNGYTLRGRLHGLNVTAERAARDQAFSVCMEGLPESAEQRFDALVGMSDAQLDEIIAHGVALTVMPSYRHEGVTGKLLDFMEFDMADHFAATPDNFTGRASKKLVVQALAEVGKAADSAALIAMKKGALATAAADLLSGTGWTPELIRTPPRTTAAGASQSAAKLAKPARARSAAKQTGSQSAKKGSGKVAA
ncbi:ParB/RepB/Spo0J family partition protein [Xanthomonas citri]|uniref:ParB/RepB/Spo0J family partition protein n=1 Tax=Xanthomonas citri TaxID=346 RepID=UPI000C397E76|nr:ParB/RepB/Spo0J family partition protein [Xanthomonas citri]SOO14138.1 hypothetical protein XFF7766_280002 [Xanthomonas citri pv. fuscans]